MNTKSFFLFTLAASAMILNLSGCKDDDEDFDYTFENCVEGVTNFTNIQNGDTICTKKLFTSDIEGAVLIKNGFNDVKGTNLIYIGTSKDNMRRVVKGEIVQLSPFTCYYLESVPCIIHGEDTIFGEKKELKFYSIPKHKLALTADYGEGEIAANIHWNLQYYYESEDSHSNHKYYTYEGSFSSVKVCLTTDVDTTYNKEIKEYPANADSCYITQGGTREKPDYPAYICRYWKDGKTIMYYDPLFYDVKIKVTLENDISVSNSIKTFLMDKQSCVCDLDNNIYRVVKIGNKTWTIDNYRGSLSKNYFYDPYEPNKSVFGDDLIQINQNGLNNSFSYIPGYHIASSDDWADLESYYGIVYPENEIELRVDSTVQKLSESDPSLQKYFSTQGTWNELLSSYGWQNEEGAFLATEQGAFNAVPSGFVSFSNVCGEYKMAAYLSYDDGSVRLISLHYKGIAKTVAQEHWVFSNVRFVKD